MKERVEFFFFNIYKGSLYMFKGSEKLRDSPYEGTTKRSPSEGARM